MMQKKDYSSEKTFKEIDENNDKQLKEYIEFKIAILEDMNAAIPSAKKIDELMGTRSRLKIDNYFHSAMMSC